MRRVSLMAALIVALLGGAAPAFAMQEKSANPRAAASAAAATATVNLNTASAAELQTLPGVGAATAKLIIDHRQKSGGFKKIEELMNIKGIGEKSFLKIKPRVTVGGDKTEQSGTGKSL
jgi:competence protein ComEA